VRSRQVYWANCKYRQIR